MRTLSLCTCCRHYPGAAAGRILRSFTQPCQPSPKGLSGRPAHRPFRGLHGVHSHYGLHTRAVTVYRDTLTEGFSHFVASVTAPVASGWSGCRVGLTPTGKRRLSTAHTRSSHRVHFPVTASVRAERESMACGRDYAYCTKGQYRSPGSGVRMCWGSPGLLSNPERKHHVTSNGHSSCFGHHPGHRVCFDRSFRVARRRLPRRRRSARRHLSRRCLPRSILAPWRWRGLGCRCRRCSSGGPILLRQTSVWILSLSTLLLVRTCR